MPNRNLRTDWRRLRVIRAVIRRTREAWDTGKTGLKISGEFTSMSGQCDLPTLESSWYQGDILRFKDYVQRNSSSIPSATRIVACCEGADQYCPARLIDSHIHHRPVHAASLHSRVANPN